MASRREFLRRAVASFVLAHGDGRLLAGRPQRQPAGAGRRQVTVAGSRVRVIDIHAHCEVPLHHVVKDTPLEREGGGGEALDVPARIRQMDARGIDVQALSINGYWWYAADRDLAARIVTVQNAGLAELVSRAPERLVALASVSLQFPDLAAQQLKDAVRRQGLRGVSIGGHVNGADLSLPAYDPFWAAAAELGVPVFMHPGGAENIIRPGALGGRGSLANIIGNPLETTYFLSRLIFDGTLDRHPGLRLIAPHGGGYLPSYLARTDVACEVRENANCANQRHPRSYFTRQILADSMVFTDEGLRHLVKEIGAAQVVYGTDMPYTWPDTLDHIVDASYLSAAEKLAILGGNLSALLRIPS